MGEPRDRARNFSVIALAFSTAGVLGPMLAGFSIDALGHRHTFFALGAFLVANLAIMSFKRIEISRPATSLKPGERRHVGDLLRDPTMRRVFVVSGMLSMAWDLFSFVMPIHGSRLGLSATTIGFILGAFGAAVFVVRLILPLFVRRVDEWKMLVGAMFATAVVMALIPLFSDVALLTALSFLLGIGLGGAQPMIMALLYEKAPPGRGAEAVGVRTLLLNFSQSGIPLMFGVVGAALGMTPVFVVMAVALGAGGWYARRGG
jgi:predicted MFS family arabinose efflux permease